MRLFYDNLSELSIFGLVLLSFFLDIHALEFFVLRAENFENTDIVVVFVLRKH